MASTTVHRLPSDGSTIRRGTASVANGDTVSTGLSQVNGFVAYPASSDVVISVSTALPSTTGDVTVRIHAAGVASGTERTIYWEAWDYRRV